MSKNMTFFYKLIMVVFIMIGLILILLISFLWGTFVCYLLFGVFLILFYASWVLFRQPQEIILDDRNIIFKTFLGKVTMQLNDLVSIKCDRDKEDRMNAEVKSTQRKFHFNPFLIKDWDEVIESIKTINPNIEIKKKQSPNPRSPQSL